jgi:hypothetical protein
MSKRALLLLGILRLLTYNSPAASRIISGNNSGSSANSAGYDYGSNANSSFTAGAEISKPICQLRRRWHSLR